jgi:hypothetical protein
MKARLALLATLFVTAIVSACGDPTNLKASLFNTVDTLSVYALSGTPPTYPSGISIVARQAVRVDGFAGFDVAFDINSSGQAVIYPVKLVVASAGGARPVGLQKVPGTFETVLDAPKSGFQTDSAVVAGVGEVVVMESTHNSNGDVCSFSLSPNLYGKISIESIDLVARIIKIRLGVDPNCGFRSFADGVPTS